MTATVRLYRAAVIDTADPTGAGRILVQVGRGTRSKPSQVEFWAAVAPLAFGGGYFVPAYQPGDLVLLAAERVPSGSAVVLNCLQSATPLSSLPLELSAERLAVNTAVVELNAPVVRCAGTAQCDTLVANLVAGTSYTPGAGNLM